MGGGGERAERLRLLQQEDKGEAPGLVLQLVLSCLANLSAVGGGACVVAHGGVELMLRAAVGDETLRRYALAGLLNVCAHPRCAALIRGSAVPPLLRKLAKIQTKIDTYSDEIEDFERQINERKTAIAELKKEFKETHTIKGQLEHVRDSTDGAKPTEKKVEEKQDSGDETDEKAKSSFFKRKDEGGEKKE